MSPFLRALLTILGTLSIVAATVILLRGTGDILPPALAAGLAFTVGIGLLLLAFTPEQMDHHPRAGSENEAERSRIVSSAYGSAAMARLQETIEPREEPTRRL